MKKKYNCFSHRGYWMHIIAGILIVCMLFVDASLYLSLNSDNLPYGNDEDILEEDHILETVQADGNYDGTSSSLEISKGDDDPISVKEEVNDIYSFRILEIVRGEGFGTIGYFLNGFEPAVDDTPEMRHAFMDALVNGGEICGSEHRGQNIPWSINNLKTQMADNGGKEAFTITEVSYTGNGYYKYVGEGNGLYSVYNNSLDRKNHKVQMVSKFYDNGSNRSNDYIWVETSMTFEELLNSDTVDDTKDIIVKDHKRFKYVNNDVFLNKMYTPQSYDADKDRYSSTSLDDWKKNHKIELKTRTCGELSTEDIRWADLIIVSNGNDVASQAAFQVYKDAHPEKRNLPDQNSLPALEFESFEHVFAIYDQVVAKEETAIVLNVNEQIGSNTIDTNLKKLVVMLFYIDKAGEETGGSGRDMFMDYFKYYVDKWEAPGQRIDAPSNREVGHISEPNGYMYQDFPRIQVSGQDSYDSDAEFYYDIKVNKVNEKGYFKMDPGKSNTTDYIYIDEKTGNFMVDTKYAGYVYWVDYDGQLNDQKGGFAHRYVTWDNLAAWNNSSSWPWERGTNGEGQDFLKHWWFSTTVTDQSDHLPIYYQYYGWGPYRVRTNNRLDSDDDREFQNQGFSYENNIYKTDLIKNVVYNRSNKREYTDPIGGEGTGDSTKKYYYISLNIENGDGVNKTNKGNKVLYVNDYEIKQNRINELPIHFILKSSENISKIELLKSGNSQPIVTFIPKSSNDISKPESDLDFTGGKEGLTLKNETSYSGSGDSKKPEKDAAHNNLYIYKYKGDINKDLTVGYFNTGKNNQFILRAWIEPVPGVTKYVDDTIYVVRRDFFMLD